jgi:hypothetical protein
MDETHQQRDADRIRRALARASTAAGHLEQAASRHRALAEEVRATISAIDNALPEQLRG